MSILTDIEGGVVTLFDDIEIGVTDAGAFVEKWLSALGALMPNSAFSVAMATIQGMVQKDVSATMLTITDAGKAVQQALIYTPYIFTSITSYVQEMVSLAKPVSADVSALIATVTGQIQTGIPVVIHTLDGLVAQIQLSIPTISALVSLFAIL